MTAVTAATAVEEPYRLLRGRSVAGVAQLAPNASQHVCGDAQESDFMNGTVQGTGTGDHSLDTTGWEARDFLYALGFRSR